MREAWEQRESVCASICFGSKYCHFVSVALRPPSRSVQFDQGRETKKKLQQRTNTNKGNKKRENRIISLSCVGWGGGSYRAWAKTASHGETRYVIKSFDKPILSPAPFHSDPVVYTLPTLDLFRHPKVLTISRRSTHGKSKISNKTHKEEEDSILLPFNRRNKATNQTVEHVGAGSATRGRTKIDQRRERVRPATANSILLFSLLFLPFIFGT